MYIFLCNYSCFERNFSRLYERLILKYGGKKVKFYTRRVIHKNNTLCHRPTVYLFCQRLVRTFVCNFVLFTGLGLHSEGLSCPWHWLLIDFNVNPNYIQKFVLAMGLPFSVKLISVSLHYNTDQLLALTNKIAF